MIAGVLLVLGVLGGCGHVGANGKTEAALASDVAAKVKAAAEAKLPGATVERVETDVDHGAPSVGLSPPRGESGRASG